MSFVGSFVLFCFVSAFEKYCATYFWPPWFLMRDLLSFELLSSTADVINFFECIKIFFFVYSFQKFKFCMDFFGLILGFSQLCQFSYVSCQFVDFPHCFLKYFFSPVLFFSYLFRTQRHECLICCCCPTAKLQNNFMYHFKFIIKFIGWQWLVRLHRVTSPSITVYWTPFSLFYRPLW